MLKMNESTERGMLIRAELMVVKNGLLKQSSEPGGCHPWWVQEVVRTAMRVSHHRRSQGTDIDSLPFDWHIIFAHIYEV